LELEARWNAAREGPLPRDLESLGFDLDRVAFRGRREACKTVLVRAGVGRPEAPRMIGIESASGVRLDRSTARGAHEDFDLDQLAQLQHDVERARRDAGSAGDAEGL